MIKSQKYSSKKTSFFAGTYEDSTLKAKLRFRSEVAPGSRRVIRERMVTSYRDGKENLYTYFIRGGFIAEQDQFNNIHNGVSVNVETKPYRLGLDIEATSNKSMTPIEQIVNLKLLNTFMLTGKLPEKIISTP